MALLHQLDNLTTPILPLVLLSLLVLSFVTYHYLIHPWLISPLARIPNGHWSAPFSRLWILRVRYQRRENRTLHALHAKLGPVVRVGPKELSVDGLEGLRGVYQQGGSMEKPDWYSVFDNYGVHCMFSSLSSAEHSARKRLISHVYSKSFVQSSTAVSAQAGAILYGRLLPLIHASTTTPQTSLDMYSVFMGVTMDVVTAYALGLDKGTNLIEDEATRTRILKLYGARNLNFFDHELPWLTRTCRKWGIPLLCPKWVDEANNELHEWCMRMIERAAATTTTSTTSTTTLNDNKTRSTSHDDPVNEPVVYKTLLNGFTSSTSTTTKGGPTSSILYPIVSATTQKLKLSIASELFDHALAGQETAGIALSYVAWRLSQSLPLQAQLRTELLTHLTTPNNMHWDPSSSSSSSSPSSSSNLIPDPKQLDALPLLHAILMETLRLHAPIPGPQPRLTSESSSSNNNNNNNNNNKATTIIGGHPIPPGVRVASLAYTLHRNQKVFPDPERWDHTRWLLPSESTTLMSAQEDDEERRKQMNRYFWAFGSGGRMCVGSNFAMHEMKLILAAIYSNYTSHIVDDAGMAEQMDAYTARPAYESLILRFERV